MADKQSRTGDLLRRQPDLAHRYLVPKMTLTGQGRLTQLSHSTTG